MKYALWAAITALFLGTAGAQAGTVSGTFGVSAQIVSGKTASATIVNGEAVTQMRDSAPARHDILAGGSNSVPPLQVSFTIKPDDILTERTTWDPSLHLLTMDF
jgi:hypothetical protein